MKLGLLFFTLVFSTFTQASVFKKCYQVLTNSPLNKSHKLLIRSSRENQLKQCKSLLQNLHHNSFDLTNIKILNTLNKLHLSFFKNFQLFMPADIKGMKNYVDFEEPALAITYNFINNLEVSSLLQGNLSYIAKRTKPIIHEPPKFFDGKVLKEWKPLNIQRGKLISISRKDLSTTSFSHHSDHLFYPKIIKRETHPYKNFGGGIIGLNSYLTFTRGLAAGTTFRDTHQLPRRWVKSIYTDFLCSDIGKVNKTYAAKYVNKKTGHSFDKEIVCLQCHVPMDATASLIKDKQLVYSNSKQIQASTHVIKLPPSDNRPEFQPYIEKSRFILIKDNKISLNKEVSSLDQLGDLITKTDEFYSCFLERYYKFIFNNESFIEFKNQREYQEILTQFKKEKSLKNLMLKLIEQIK